MTTANPSHLIVDIQQLPFSDETATTFNSAANDIFRDQFKQYFSNNPPNLKSYKALLADFNEQMNAAFDAKKNIEDLIHFRANFIDVVLETLWNQQSWIDSQIINLVAVGGYGRGELHPFSDIDILILCEQTPTNDNKTAIESFLTALWDFGLIVGHSVRTLDECIDIASEDVTVITNLIESRHLIGDTSLYKKLDNAINKSDFWQSKTFFSAKLEEQKNRHSQFNNTEYNLEPNTKESPGGLRDIQMLSWIVNRHTGSRLLEELITSDFLSASEFEKLISNRNYLWRIRYALHLHYQGAEDRLLFDAQKSLAKSFGFEDDSKKLAVEHFMQEYFRSVLSVGALNEVLMQLFDENILHPSAAKTVTDINDKFQIIDQLIDIKDEDEFEKNPSSLLEIFVHFAGNEKIIGMRAKSIRAINQNLHLIDDKFRSDPKNHQLFLQLLQAPGEVATVLKNMKRFGVLGKYIPAFEQIIGQTQHDLFHIYSVDAHTILLALNIQRFNSPSAKKEWPILYDVMNEIENIELLYLAAIFHDIAKGRGGDHSSLGALDAFDFCRLHGLSLRDSNLVAWLVEKHLLMSATAQRKDIDDPEIIREFALEMGDRVHLNYLFALTVADINATNKKLWNSWRASLMRRLYTNTKRALRRGLEHYIDRADWISDKQQKILTLLREEGINPEEARRIWDEPNNDYFLRERTDSILHNTLLLAKYKESNSKKPLITLTHPVSKKSERSHLGASKIFIHMPIHTNMFAVITTALEQLDLSVQNARIYATRQGYTLDTYFVLDSDNRPLDLSEERNQLIIKTLHEELDNPEEFSKIVKRRTSRRLKHFAKPTRTYMSYNNLLNCNILEVQSPDRPGLLARIARVFSDFDIKLVNVKIATLGDTVEDVFFITDKNDQAFLEESVCNEIQAAICNKLDQENEDPSL